MQRAPLSEILSSSRLQCFSAYLFCSHGLKHLLQQDPHLLDVVHQHARLREDQQQQRQQQQREGEGKGKSRRNQTPQHREEVWVKRWVRWRSTGTHYLLLLTVGGEALGQQGAVLQQHLGDGLPKHTHAHMGHGYCKELKSRRTVGERPLQQVSCRIPMYCICCVFLLHPFLYFYL